MPFHRLTVPTYFGGLPGGFDYINNAVSGTPAPADSAKAVGPNTGTYFIAFGEDGIQVHVNRPVKALAENTDYLDDLFRRDVAVVATTANATVSGSPLASIALTGPGIFLGAVGTPNTGAGIATFIKIVDDQDKDIIDASGTPCRVSAISGGTVGSGLFSAGSLTLTVSPAIPVGKTYRLHYGTRSNLAVLPPEALIALKIQSSETVPALLLAPGGAGLVGTAGAPAWADSAANPATTVEGQLDKIVSDLVDNAGSSRIRDDGGPNWADSTTNPAGTSIAARLDKIVSDLAALAGAARIGAAAAAGTPFALADGSISAQLAVLLGAVNTLAGKTFGLSTVTVTSSGPVTAPPKAVLALLEGWGAGGGGGQGSDNPGADSHAAGGGGGGGAQFMMAAVPITGGANYQADVGVGGPGGTHATNPNGSVGGDTVFTRLSDLVVLATFRGAGGGGPGNHDSGLGPDAQSYGAPGSSVRSVSVLGSGFPTIAPTEDPNLFFAPSPQWGSAGLTSNNARGDAGWRAGPSPQGFLGGIQGTNNGTVAGSYYGGGAGGAGGAGPGGHGGQGGDGGAPNNSGVGANGDFGQVPSGPNTGAGGGGGGGAGSGSTAGSLGGEGAQGGDGLLRITWVSLGP